MDDRCCRNCPTEIRDFGGAPLVINMDRAARLNQNYRTALWTGKYLQVTLMSIPAGGDIGAEVHPDVDQFLRIESGTGIALTGSSRSGPDRRQSIDCHTAVIIPAGTWHNIVNTGNTPLKLYSICAPPHHPFGTVQSTKADAT